MVEALDVISREYLRISRHALVLNGIEAGFRYRFWLLFLGSLALGQRYPWLDAVWYWAWMLFLVVVGVFAAAQIFSNRHESEGFVGYRGVPRWVVTLFGDEVDPPKKESPKKQ